MRNMTKKKKVVAAAGMIVVVAAAGTGLVIHGKSADDGSQTTVQSAEAETGNISTTVVGTGTLESGAATDILVPSAIEVTEVLVESGDTVEAGQELATVDEVSVASALLEVNEQIEDAEDALDDLSDEADTEGTTEYLEAKVLNGTLSDLKETQTFLTQMLETKTITATCAGTISSVNVSGDTQETGNTGSSGTTSGNGSSSALTAMSTKAATATQANAGGEGNRTAAGASPGIITLAAEVSDSPAQVLSEVDGEEQTGETSISTCSVDVTAPETGKKPQTKIGETEGYAGTISWNCTTDTFQPATVYTATLTLTAKEGYIFSPNILPEVNGADVVSEVRESDAGESILVIKARFAKTGADQSNNNTGNTQNTDKTQSTGTGTGTSTGAGSQTGTSVKTAGASSAGTGSTASSGGTGDVTSEYSIEETAMFSIASQSDAVVSVDVDELDILSVKEGLTATVTLDALEGQEFKGTITNVSESASGGSSSAKYPVEITFEKTEDMRLGMSASATIQIEESEDAVLIPVEALQERGDTTFVYTKKDSDGNLSEEVEVETGLSNGSQVEIISGLSEGDTVYYLKAQGSENSSEKSGMQMPGSGEMPGGGEKPDGGQMPGGGDMPDGGQMPAGGSPGGSRDSGN